MIPLELSLEGLYSYRSPAEIDFTPLTEAGLFGIFGPVGSGKSTILDGISLALYGESDRLGGREKKNYNLMNLQSDKLSIEFRFRHEGQTYLFTMNGERNRKNFQEIRNVKRRAYRLDGDEWTPLHETESGYSAEEILVIGYRNFRRTIIVPQGKFQEFLQLRPAERRNMMQEIFHLDRYDLYDPTARLLRAAGELRNTIQAKLEQLDTVTAEVVRQNTQEIKALEALLQELDGKKQELSGRLRQYAELEGIHRELKDRQAEMQHLLEREGEILERREKMEQFADCRGRFLQPLEQLKERTGEYRSSRQTLGEKGKVEKELSDKSIQVRQELEKVRPAYINREELRTKARFISQLGDVKTNEEKLRELEKARVNSEEQVREKGRLIEQTELEQTRLRDGLEKLQEKANLLGRTEGLSQWYTERRHLEKILEEKGTALENRTAAIQSLQEEVRQRAAELQSSFDALDQCDRRPIEGTFHTLFEGLEANREEPGPDLDKAAPDKVPFEKVPFDKARAEIESRIEELEKEETRQEVKQVLLRYSRGLKDGEACPLCGAVEHPQPMHTVFSAEEEDEIPPPGSAGSLDRLEKLRKLRDQLLSDREAVNRIFSQVVSERRQQKKSRADREEILEKLDGHLQKFSWREYGPKEEEIFRKAARDAAQAQEELQKFSNEAKELEDALAALKVDLEGVRNAERTEDREIVRVQERIETLRKDIPSEITRDYGEASAEELRQAVVLLEEEYRRVDERYRQLEEAQQEVSEELNLIRGEIKITRSQLKLTADRIGDTAAKLYGLLDSSAYGSLHPVREILGRDLDLEKERGEIESYFREREGVSRRIGELEQKVEGYDFPYSSEEHAELQNSEKKVDAEISDSWEKKGQLQEKGRTLSRQMAEKKKLEKELKQVDERYDNLNILLGMFKGKGFINFVATRYLHDLCSLANDRFFQLTHKQMKLELNEENDFVVRDFLNGGRLRSAKTLSGGQLFQASFSLALALADSIQQNREGFFFMDEGFGALDRDSIQEVCTTLKSLRKEDRVVGVISHLEQLRDEIPVYLKVENRPEEGSTVSPRWE